MKRLFLLIMLLVFSIGFTQTITNKYLAGKWEVSEVQLDPKAFDDSNIDNFNVAESFFQNVKFLFSKNGLVKIETQEKILAPFKNDLFNTVLFYSTNENILNIGSWKKSSNILYDQIMKDNDFLILNFSGGLLKIKKIEKNIKLKIDKNLIKKVRPLLYKKPLLFEKINDDKKTEESFDKIISTYNCSHLKDKTLLKKCVSMTITNFFNRKFNTEIASNLGLSGLLRNKVHFIINKEGNIINIKGESKNSGLSEEIIRTINQLPKFIPAEKNGVPVNYKYSFPFIFRVQY